MADRPLAWRCSRCGEPMALHGERLSCRGCGQAVTRVNGHWPFAPSYRPAGFSPDRRHHLATLEKDHFWFPPRRRLLVNLLDGFIGGDRLAAAIDLGCGSGGFLTSLAQRAKVVAGADAYEESLTTAHRRCPSAELMQCDLSRVPLSAAQFDLVCALDVLEHLDPAVLLAEARRLSRSDGWLLVTVPALPSLWSELDLAAGHRCRYRLPDLRHELEAHGWRLVHWTSYQCLLLALVWLSRRGPLAQLHRVERRPPRVVSRVLAAVNHLEVRLTAGWRLPWGSSLVALATAEP